MVSVPTRVPARSRRDEKLVKRLMREWNSPVRWTGVVWAAWAAVAAMFSNSAGEWWPRVLWQAVVEGLDVVEDFGAQLGACRPGAAVDQLLLERREEAFSDGVVEAVPA